MFRLPLPVPILAGFPWANFPTTTPGKAVVPAGSPFTITALGSSGDVTVTLAAPGFPSRSLLVHLTTPTFHVSASTVTAVLGDYARFSVLATPANGYLRQNVNYTFALTFSNPSILRNDTPVVTFQSYGAYVAPTAIAEGTTTVTLTATSGAVLDPGGATVTVTVVPRTFGFGQPTLVLGKNLERPLPQLNYPNPGIAQLRSSDPSRVLLSHDPGLGGSETLDTNGPVYAQALADSGDVTITASAPGYSDTQLRVRLYPTALAAYDPTSTRTTTTIGSTLSLRVAPVLMDPDSGSPILLNDVILRGGLDPFQVALVSSNPSIGRLLSPIGFLGGLRDNTTQFRADANGTTDISVTPPDGFADAGPILIRHIEVSAPRLVLGDITLGKDMQFYAQVNTMGFTGASPVSVTVTSSDPGSVLVSASPTDVGSGIATVSSNGSGFFYVQALAGQGDVTITAIAAGFDPVTATVHLEPSYFTFNLSGSRSATDTAFVNSTYQAAIYLTHPSYQYPSNKFLRPGLGSLTIPVVSSNPAVLSQKAPVIFPPNYDQVSAQFIASADGMATLQIGAPTGFSQPPPVDGIDNVTVLLNRFSFYSITVGKDRSGPLGSFYSAGSPTTVHVVSNDPTLALLSTDPKAAGAAEVFFDIGPGLPGATVYVYGLAASGTTTLSAAATGFQTSTSTVNLTPSGFVFSYSNQLSVQAGGAATTRISSGSPIRGGIAPRLLYDR